MMFCQLKDHYLKKKRKKHRAKKKKIWDSDTNSLSRLFSSTPYLKPWRETGTNKGLDQPIQSNRGNYYTPNFEMDKKSS